MIKEDFWIWGKELIISQESDPFTIKLIQPKNGVEGSLSLQFHNHKSEYWYVLSGVGVAQFIVEEEILTVRATKGKIFFIKPRLVHRLGSIQELTVFEVSSIDKHAFDKTQPKDVVRLHCFHGRETAVGNFNTKVLAKSVDFFFKALEENFPEEDYLLRRLTDLGIYLGEKAFI